MGAKLQTFSSRIYVISVCFSQASVNGGFFTYEESGACASVSIVRLDGVQLANNAEDRTALGMDDQGVGN